MSRTAALSPLVIAAAVLSTACFGTTNPVAGPTQQQTASASTSTTPAPTDCSTLNASNFPSTIAAAGGTRTFTVSTGSACEWSGTTDVTWATLTPAAGIGSRSVTLTVGRHTRFDSRSMTATINGRTFQLVQSGIDCTYSVRPTTLDAANGGESTIVQVTATAGCSWTAVSSEDWIRPIPASGTGSGPLELFIAPHSGGSRSAVVTVEGIRINITQRPR